MLRSAAAQSKLRFGLLGQRQRIRPGRRQKISHFFHFKFGTFTFSEGIFSFNMMETVLIQINNSKAYRLLKDLEDLQIIKVLKKSVQPKQKLSEKYAGKLPSDMADELQKFVTQGRREWENQSI